MRVSKAEQARRAVLKQVWEMMVNLKKNYSDEAYKAIWEYVYSFNSHTPGKKIFLCECESNGAAGLCLEDDYIIYD